MSKINAYLRKDGRFECRITLGSDKNGKKKSKSFYGKTKEEAEFKATSVLQQNNAEYAVTELTVGQLAEDFLKVMTLNVKESTLANYRMKIEKHIIPEFGRIQCCKLNVNAVHNYIAKKLKIGLSARYICDILVLFKSMFRYAMRTYGIRNILENVVLPKKSKPVIQIYTKAEQRILEKYLSTHNDLTAHAISISLYAGLRIGEVCALKWENIDLEKRIITVSHTIQRIQMRNGSRKTKLAITEPKSASSRREIPIPDCLYTLLEKYRDSADKFVISGTTRPVEPRTMQYRFAGILRNANLPSVHFHSLRHLFATNCVALGFDVKTLSEILGHSSVELTLNRYVHSSITKVCQPVICYTLFLSLCRQFGLLRWFCHLRCLCYHKWCSCRRCCNYRSSCAYSLCSFHFIYSRWLIPLR